MCVWLSDVWSVVPQRNFLSLSIMATRSFVCVYVCVCVCEHLYKFVFCVCPHVRLNARMCCMYCVVYIVLPYLNNKTGYEIRNQYTYLLLLMSLCVLIQSMYVCSVFTSRQQWFNAAKLQSERVGSVVVRSVIVDFFLRKHFFSKYPFNFGGKSQKYTRQYFEKPYCCQRWTVS